MNETNQSSIFKTMEAFSRILEMANEAFASGAECGRVLVSYGKIRSCLVSLFGGLWVAEKRLYDQGITNIMGAVVDYINQRSHYTVETNGGDILLALAA